jgi:hypothetical protein
MLTVPPRPFLRRRPPRRSAPAAPAALTLVAAAFGKTRVWARLTFDRAVDVSAFDPSSVWLGHQPNETRYDAAGPATLFTPQTVQVPLVAGARWFGAGTRLTAGAATGIVAADDGGTWAGVLGLALPFP